MVPFLSQEYMESQKKIWNYCSLLTAYGCNFLIVCFISFPNTLASCGISLGLCDLQEALGPLSRPPNTCLPTGRRPCNLLGSLAVCVSVCVSACLCVVSLTLGCGCQDAEELYELTRYQIALCFHLCPGVCVSVVSPDF